VEIRVLSGTAAKDMEEAYAIRRQVFIEDQNVPEDLEFDKYDNDSATLHVLIFNEGSIVGTARFRPYGDAIIKIERVAVLSKQRGSGFGRRIMNRIEVEAQKLGYKWVKLSAQLHARKFYERLGYQSYGDIYLEASIEHVDMEKKI